MNWGLLGYVFLIFLVLFKFSKLSYSCMGLGGGDLRFLCAGCIKSIYLLFSLDVSIRAINKLIQRAKERTDLINQQREISNTPHPQFHIWTNEISMKIKRELEKLGKHVPITSNSPIFKYIRNETEKYEKIHTASIFRTNSQNNKNETINYIIMTRKKIGRKN